MSVLVLDRTFNPVWPIREVELHFRNVIEVRWVSFLPSFFEASTCSRFGGFFNVRLLCGFLIYMA
jgi:hypothetical protein